MYPLSGYFIMNLEPLIISKAIQIVENIYFIQFTVETKQFFFLKNYNYQYFLLLYFFLKFLLF